LAGFSFVADSPAQGDSPREAFDMKSDLDLKIGDVFAGGAIHGPRYEIVLHETHPYGQSGSRED
jgi:hypothetical protein